MNVLIDGKGINTELEVASSSLFFLGGGLEDDLDEPVDSMADAAARGIGGVELAGHPTGHESTAGCESQSRDLTARSVKAGRPTPALTDGKHQCEVIAEEQVPLSEAGNAPQDMPAGHDTGPAFEPHDVLPTRPNPIERSGPTTVEPRGRNLVK